VLTAFQQVEDGLSDLRISLIQALGGNWDASSRFVKSAAKRDNGATLDF
jgi:hypothetical protein